MRERSILELGRKAYRDEQVSVWASRSQDPEALARRLEDGRQAWIAVDEAGQPAGLIDLEADGHIDMLYVSPEAVGTGVAKALYDVVEQVARRHGIVRLHTEASELAKPFFERQGFGLLHRRDLELDGVPIHNFKMEKILNLAKLFRSSLSCEMRGE